MTTNINDAIKTFLLSNPDEGTVKALIKRLQNHKQARQREKDIADLALKVIADLDQLERRKQARIHGQTSPRLLW